MSPQSCLTIFPKAAIQHSRKRISDQSYSMRNVQYLPAGTKRVRGIVVRRKFAVALLLLFAAGCAMQMVEHDAKNSCAVQGKAAFIADAKQSGIPLFIESAHAQYLCVGPDDVTHLPTFGADVIWASNLNGIGIVSVTPDSVAEKSGLRASDVLHEFAGAPVSRTGELQSAIEKVSPGDEVVIKVRRKGQDTTVTAHF
jgi:hypothetical protein